MALEYYDAYLAPLIDRTPEWETRAIADVETLGTFPDPWPAKLAVLRAYILCCIESLADETDVFSAKLKQYQAEWKAALQAARMAANIAVELPGLPLSIEWERA
jgi:tRNA(Ile)-lysidine synthase TilS/MesJ